MRVLVTGGAGYFGEIVVRRLLERGDQVRVLDIADNAELGPDVELIRGDVRDPETVRRALKHVDIVHHDVAQVSASVKLNDGYEGAVLDFPRQGVDNSSLAVGEAIVWPSLVTHPHQATPLRSGVKYGLTIWCELPNFS